MIVGAVFLVAALLVPAGSAADESVLPLPIVRLGNRIEWVPSQPGPANLDPLHLLATLPAVLNVDAVFGDTDHDGREEFIFWSSPSVTSIYEYNVAGAFQLAGSVPGLIAFAAGDLDQDGKADLVGQWGSTIRVFEAADDHSFPTLLVWASPPLSNFEGAPTIADTDGDGRMEIISSINGGASSRLIIYECDGDNTYTERYRGPLEHQAVGDKLIGDLNQNGFTDIATSGTYGYIRIVEGVADNTWTEVFADSTGLYNAYAIVGGADTDGDGQRELFVSADDGGQSARYTLIYQPSNGTFVRVATLVEPNGSTGEFNCLAKLESNGPVRFVWGQVEPRRLQVFVPTAPGKWGLETEYPDPSLQRAPLFSHDANHNGRDEIYFLSCCSETPTWVLERPTTATDVSVSPGRTMMGQVTVTPSPWINHATALLDPRTAALARSWSIYDVAGRRMFQAPTGTTTTLALPIGLFPPGMYFVRINDAAGQSIAAGRTVVIR